MRDAREPSEDNELMESLKNCAFGNPFIDHSSTSDEADSSSHPNLISSVHSLALALKNSINLPNSR